MPKQRSQIKGRIANAQQRKVAYCKYKKDLLRRAIELSEHCGQSVIVVVLNEESNRMAYYSSSGDFTLLKAHLAKKVAKEKSPHLYERFTNDDYDNICNLDYRRVRYQRKDFMKNTGSSSQDEQFEVHIKASKRQKVED